MTPGELDAALDMDDATALKVLRELRHEVEGAHRYALDVGDDAALRRRTAQLVAVDKSMDALSWRDARPEVPVGPYYSSGPLILLGVDVVGQVHVSQRTAGTWQMLARRWAASWRMYGACEVAAQRVHAGHAGPVEECQDDACSMLAAALRDARPPVSKHSRAPGGAI